MIRRAVLFTAALLMLSVSSAVAADLKPAKERLTGKWEGSMQFDEAKMRASIKKGMPDATDKMIEDQIAFAKSFATKLKFALDLSADGKASLSVGGLGPDAPGKKGKWEITEDKGADVTIKMTPEKEGEMPEELVAKFADNDTFSLLPKDKAKLTEDTPPIVFKRAK